MDIGNSWDSYQDIVESWVKEFKKIYTSFKGECTLNDYIIETQIMSSINEHPKKVVVEYLSLMPCHQCNVEAGIKDEQQYCNNCKSTGYILPE